MTTTKRFTVLFFCLFAALASADANVKAVKDMLSFHNLSSRMGSLSEAETKQLHAFYPKLGAMMPAYFNAVKTLAAGKKKSYEEVVLEICKKDFPKLLSKIKPRIHKMVPYADDFPNRLAKRHPEYAKILAGTATTIFGGSVIYHKGAKPSGDAYEIKGPAIKIAGLGGEAIYCEGGFKVHPAGASTLGSGFKTLAAFDDRK